MRREAEAAKLRKEAKGPQSSYLDFQGQRELTKDCKVRVLHTHTRTLRPDMLLLP